MRHVRVKRLNWRQNKLRLLVAGSFQLIVQRLDHAMTLELLDWLTQQPEEGRSRYRSITIGTRRFTLLVIRDDGGEG